MSIRLLRNLIISAAIGVGLALIFFQHSPVSDHGRLKEKDKAQRVFQELGFTSEQIETLNQKRYTQEQSAVLLLEKIKVDMSEIKKEFDKLEPDQVEIARIVAEIKTLQSQVIDLRIQGINEARGIMTPQQFIKFQRLMKGVDSFNNPPRN